MLNNINIIKILNYFFFISSFALFSYTNAVYVANRIETGFIVNLKYVTLLLGVGFCFWQIWFVRRCNFPEIKSLLFFREFKKVLSVILIFLFISLCFSLFNGELSNNTSVELVKLTIPIIYAFCILNTFQFKDIYNCMVFVLIFAILGYLLEIGIETFTLNNFQLISYEKSYSPFESHYSAGLAIALCTFFMYFREKPIFKYISLIFVILTFKRMSIIFAILFLILPKFLNVDRKIGKKSNFILKFLILCSVYMYYWLLQPSFSYWFEKLFNKDVDYVTMGRSSYLDSIINNGFTSFGFGSSTEFLGRSIEMDLIKILLELSIIGLIFFIYHYWDISGRHIYCTLYMLFIFCNLLTSHSLTNSFGWILIYITIGTILYKRGNDPSYVKYKRKFKNYRIVWVR